MPVTHLEKITTRAKQLRKASPKLAWQMAIKKATAELKKGVRAAVTGTKKKKTVAPKVKVAVRKKGAVRLTIGAIALNKIKTEQTHLNMLEHSLKGQQELLKVKGTTVSEKAAIRRAISKIKNSITACKAHMSALKRSL